MQVPGSESVAKRPRVSSKPAAADKATKPKRTKAKSESAPEPLETCAAQIAEAAYYLAAKRNFAPGHELDDWLEAERMLQRAL